MRRERAITNSDDYPESITDAIVERYRRAITDAYLDAEPGTELESVRRAISDIRSQRLAQSDPAQAHKEDP